jgi:ribonuclease T1
MVRRKGILYFVVAAAVAMTTAYFQQRVRTAPSTPAPNEEKAAIQRTLQLIDQGGPFPYPKDGVTFQNREHKLPERPSGYYREYTVPTPGATNRGARRIVRGRDGDTWYTADHYKTFMRIDE